MFGGCDAGACMDSIDWPEHDSTLWGVRWLDGEPHQSVRRVADVIRLRTTEFVPVREAAHAVLTELVQALPDVGSWYLLQLGQRPVALNDGDVWEGLPARRRRIFYDWMRIPFGVPLHQYSERHEAQIVRTSGLAGAIGCLRTVLPLRPDDFDVGAAAFIAVPDAIAVQVAGGVAPVVDAPSPVAGPSAASPTESAQDAGRVAPAWQSDPRYVAVLRLRTMKNFTGARETIVSV